MTAIRMKRRETEQGARDLLAEYVARTDGPSGYDEIRARVLDRFEAAKKTQGYRRSAADIRRSREKHARFLHKLEWQLHWYASTLDRAADAVRDDDIFDWSHIEVNRSRERLVRLYESFVRRLCQPAYYP